MVDAEAVLQRQAQNLPRYTSYPPANHFVPLQDGALSQHLLEAAGQAERLSIYIHVPYCDRLCWFCGCHTKHTLSYAPIAAYVETLVQEILQFGKKLNQSKKLAKLHLGGGSPSLLRAEELQAIKAALRDWLIFDDEIEISIEIDPSDVKAQTIPDMMAFGLSRASIGVQDFDAAVQQAINRPQSFEITRDVVQGLRLAGVSSINIDALYGLPLQNLERLQDTISKVISLAPDRIALFGYAHVPWMKPHQKLIAESDLPSQGERIVHAAKAAQLIVKAGYQGLGIDHFAKPKDSLAVAARAGKLHRNFQGYTDDDCEVMLGFGPSSISRFAGGYVQNEVATARHKAKLAAGQWPHARGLELAQRDQIRGWMIERLMCDFGFEHVALVERFGALGEAAWRDAETIAAQDVDGLCQQVSGCFIITPAARPLVRVVASRFDEWLGAGAFRYSKAI